MCFLKIMFKKLLVAVVSLITIIEIANGGVISKFV